MRTLAALADIPDNTARSFPASPGGFTRLFVVRRGDQAYAYVNACPHIGVALDWAPDQFLTADAAQIVCGTHGALFDIPTGLCVAGPCKGETLEAIPLTILNGLLLVRDDAGL